MGVLLNYESKKNLDYIYEFIFIFTSFILLSSKIFG